MPARQVRAQRLALLHGEDRRVGHGAVLDAERVEAGQQALGCFGHARGDAAATGGLQSRSGVLEARLRTERGRSSGVEHDLAKVGVEGSNPFARSI